MSEDSEWLEITRVLRVSASTAPACLILTQRRGAIVPRVILRGPAREHLQQYGPRFRVEVAKDGLRLRITEDLARGTFEVSSRRHTASLYLPACPVWTQPTQCAVDCEWAIAGTARGMLITIPRDGLLAAQRGERLALPKPAPKLAPPANPVRATAPAPPARHDVVQVLDGDPDAESYTPTQLGILETVPIAWGERQLCAIQRLLAYGLATRREISIEAARLITRIEGSELEPDAIRWHVDQLRDALAEFGIVVTTNRNGAFLVPRTAQIALCRRLKVQPPEV